jgi:flagellar basal-body rod modification protein FlgD
MSVATQNQVTQNYLPETQQAATSQSASGTQTLDKDQFLKLLIAQMKYQDPLNPMDATQFTAQLAQFTSLEQLYNVNSGLKTLNDTVTAQNSYQATSLIGKQVRAEGQSLAVKDGQPVVSGGYELASAANEVQVTIYDQNGQVVKSDLFQNQDAGYHALTWDGKNAQGKPAPDGAYTFDVKAGTSDGGTVGATRFMVGEVSGLTLSTDGSPLLLLNGLGVSLTSVVEVENVKKSNQE